MGKLGDKFKDGKIVGLTLIGVVVLAGGGLGIAALTSANAEPAAVVKTVEPVDFASLPYTNGLAGEQETDAAAAVAAEQERLAAEAAAAEAARVAAEQAAAVEAERVAAEQVLADEPAGEEPAPGGGGLPSGAVPPNVPGSDQPDSTACASSSLTWDGSQSVCA